MKRFISVLLSGIIALSSCVFAYAQDDYSQILLSVKELYDIGEYDDFSYNPTELGDVQSYEFVWESDDGEYLDITVNKDLYTLGYYLSHSDDTEDNENIINNTQAESVANEFLKKAMGDRYNYFKLNSSLTTVSQHMIQFVFEPYYNSYLIESVYSYSNAANALIGVDLTTAEVTEYRSSFGNYNLNNITTSEPVSISVAKDAFLSDENMELVYVNVYDYENEKSVAKPLYRFNTYYIDAITGKPVLNEEELFEETASADTASLNASGLERKATLTDEEKSEIEKLQNALTKEEAVKLVNDKFGLSVDASNAEISYDKNSDEGYDVYVSVPDIFNASISYDGIIEYCSYYSDDFKLSGYSNIKSFINRVYPSADFPVDLKADEYKTYDDNYRCEFNNKVNGIKDTSSYISIYYDSNLNAENGFNYRYNNSEHISFDRELTKEEIYKIATDNTELELVYVSNSNETKPCYRFEKEFTIDASNGDFLNSWGDEFEEEAFTEYKDVEGTWYGELANALIAYGYSFESDVFDGNKNVTAKDLAEFADTDIDDDENPDREITKYELAKIIVSEMGYTKVAEKADFELPFGDVSDEYRGYVAICKAFGIAKGSNNMFNGERTVTRAEMASMFYNLVISRG